MSNRVFGFVWCFIIGFFALLPLWRGQAIYVPLAIVALLLALIATAVPSLLALPNRMWICFGKAMHGVISNVALFLIYFLFITPGAALLRLFGRKQLKLRFDPKASTYWAKRSSGGTDFTRPY